jgi:hypothetical protein
VRRCEKTVILVLPPGSRWNTHDWPNKRQVTALSHFPLASAPSNINMPPTSSPTSYPTYPPTVHRDCSPSSKQYFLTVCFGTFCLIVYVCHVPPKWPIRLTG